MQLLLNVAMSTPDFGMIDWTDAQLDEMFLRSEVRPLDGFLNGGEHRVDLDAHEIYNDQRWKGFMPKGLPVSEATAQLSLGFAKKLWKLKRGFESLSLPNFQFRSLSRTVRTA